MLKQIYDELKNPKTLIFFILGILFFLIGTGIHLKKSERSTHNDFLVYYKTAQRVEASNWQKIYTLDDGAFPYRYIPYTLPVLSKLSSFPEKEARKIWLALQALFFFIGLIYLYKSLRLIKCEYPLQVTSLTFLLVGRQFLDSLYSGQVSGLIFLSFSLGLYFFLDKKPARDVVFLSIASSLKIAPGILLIHSLVKAPNKKKMFHLLFIGFSLFFILNVITYLWLKNLDAENFFISLWDNWLHILRNDGNYFDGSTPKNQALRGFLLRTFGIGDLAEYLWKILSLIGILGLIWHWIKIKKSESVSLAYEAQSYCLGIMAYILFMPQSLPYQIINNAIPLAVLMATKKNNFKKTYQVMLISFMVFISFASTDFLGRSLSDTLQSKSFAFFVMCLMTFLLFKNQDVVKT
jgi:hypothetical protein